MTINTSPESVASMLARAAGTPTATTIPAAVAGGGQETLAMTKDEVIKALDEMSDEDRDEVLGKYTPGTPDAAEDADEAAAVEDEDAPETETETEVDGDGDDDEAPAATKAEPEAKADEPSMIAKYESMLAGRIEGPQAAALVLEAVKTRMSVEDFFGRALEVVVAAGGGGGGNGQSAMGNGAPVAGGVRASVKPLGGGRGAEAVGVDAGVLAYQAKVDEVQRQRRLDRPAAVALVNAEFPDLRRAAFARK